jgi:UDP-4-amino-4,6-dideoxy-N-acetyl-beta-L-altrosamine transaminase
MNSGVLEKPNCAKRQFLPYGRQSITAEDISAVIEVLKSDWLTQGPTGLLLEKALAEKVSAKEAVVCSSGTTALHLAMLALGIGPGDKIITSTNSFLASANCARYVGADVLFADIDSETGLISVNSLQEILQKDKARKVKVIVPVHFAGQPADMADICRLAKEHGAYVVEDACHALGATYKCGGVQSKIGSCQHSDMTIFSFHPVKHVTTGEGGAITTSDSTLASQLRSYRSHGMQKEIFHNQEMAISSSGEKNPWYYEMQDLGYNYRLTDIQAALGLSQLNKLENSLKARQTLASCYDKLVADNFDSKFLRPLTTLSGRGHAYHLYVVRIDFDHFGRNRATVINSLRENGIGTQVHYIPIHLQPYYRKLYGTKPGDCPNAEKYYLQALSLPMYPDLTPNDCGRVIAELRNALME